jgi:hypothetical protein
MLKRHEESSLHLLKSERRKQEMMLRVLSYKIALLAKENTQG